MVSQRDRLSQELINVFECLGFLIENKKKYIVTRGFGSHLVAIGLQGQVDDQMRLVAEQTFTKVKW